MSFEVKISQRQLYTYYKQTALIYSRILQCFRLYHKLLNVPSEKLKKNVFLTRECAHAHERVIAIMVFSLGRLLPRLVGSVVNFRACAVNEF